MSKYLTLFPIFFVVPLTDETLHKPAHLLNIYQTKMTSEKAIIKNFSFLAAKKADNVKAFIGLEKESGQRVSGLVLFTLNKGVWRIDTESQRDFSDNVPNRENKSPVI